MKNIELIEAVARDLLAINVSCVFFGGTVVGLHLDRLPPDDEERPTTDVDCVPVAISNAADMFALEQKMSAVGWKHDVRPIQKNTHGRISPSGIPVDFVPLHTMAATDPVRLANRVEIELAESLTIHVVDSAGMVAAKLAAFRDRGASDPLLSHDLEDLTMLLACCSSLETSLAAAPTALREQVHRGLGRLARDHYILDIIDGSVPRGIDPALVLDRLQQLARFK